MHDFGKSRLYLLLTFVLAGVFVTKHFDTRVTYAWRTAFTARSWRSTTLTGLHGLHIIGGMIVMAYLLAPAKMHKERPDQFIGRIEYTGLYWHFVHLVDLPVPGFILVVGKRGSLNRTLRMRSVRL
jgi:heme/copper-type cytochrome/quinol oxidase subunit 3